MGLHQKIEHDLSRAKNKQDKLLRQGIRGIEFYRELGKVEGIIQAKMDDLALVDEDARLRQEQLRKLLAEFPHQEETEQLQFWKQRVLLWQRKAEKELFERGV